MAEICGVCVCVCACVRCMCLKTANFIKNIIIAFFESKNRKRDARLEEARRRVESGTMRTEAKVVLKVLLA